MNKMVRVHLLFHGRVQGVGFRLFAQQEATNRQVVGWVRNVGDTQVEAEAEGTPASIQALLDATRQGPELARVDQCDVQWIPILETEHSYKILESVR
ncbi:MAG: acylphosphatase [Nitrospirales bacterium]|nr:acylphosphatase [Nitrospirales bacterium]